MKYILNHKEEIITNLISNVIWYIVSLFIVQLILWHPFILGLLQGLRKGEYKIPAYAFIMLGASFVIMFLIMSFSVFTAVKLHKKLISAESGITTDLIYNSLDIELYFKDRKNIVTYLTYDCAINKEHYNEDFKKNIIWTGGTYNYTKLIESDGEYSLTDSERKSSPHTYTISFNKPLSFGDKVHFKLETSVNDNDLSMTPVFSHMIKHQTMKLKIHLTVPKNLIKNARAAVYRDVLRAMEIPNDISLETANAGDLILYSYSVDDPKLLHNYCIEWEFK